MRRTRILATVGPATSSPQSLDRLIRAGADGLRLNFAHGTSVEHRMLLRRARAVMRRAGREIALLGDLEGPKVRIGSFERGSVELMDGQPWTLDSSPLPGSAERASLVPLSLLKSVPAGAVLLLGDGSVRLIVERVRPHALDVRVSRGGTVRSHAGLYIPGVRLRAALLGPKDLSDLTLAVREGIDFLGLSFVRDGADVVRARRALNRIPGGGEVGLIAKIERAEALVHADEIIAEADAIMVARGDLGIEVPLERLALEQKSLVRQARAAGKPSIVATQMLLSMVSSPRPTRAEATDVANAVLDGADVLMLSEESAIGEYPTEAVTWLGRIAEATEGSIVRGEPADAGAMPPPQEAAVARAAVTLAEDLRADAIVAPTHSGRTPEWISSLRPVTPIFALSPREHVRRRLSLVWGVSAQPCRPHLSLDALRGAAAALVRARLRTSGPVVLTAGYPVRGSPTNLVTVLEHSPGRRRRAQRT